VVIITPRIFTIPDAARYLSATTWFVRELLRSGSVPSFIQGKNRVVDRLELDKYIDRRNAEAPMTLKHRSANFNREAA
jgi:excisionase family DNA binding protein